MTEPDVWTPDTAAIREWFSVGAMPMSGYRGLGSASEAFDRWLAKHDAEEYNKHRQGILDLLDRLDSSIRESSYDSNHTTPPEYLRGVRDTHSYLSKAIRGMLETTDE